MVSHKSIWERVVGHVPRLLAKGTVAMVFSLVVVVEYFFVVVSGMLYPPRCLFPAHDDPHNLDPTRI